MNKIKAYLVNNFEQTFVLVILVGVALINYFIPYKLAFLNFYFIPVLLTAYYLDVRRALLGAVLCLIMVGVYFYLDPASFSPGKSNLDLALNIVTWAGFLILSGALVGSLNHKLQEEIRQTLALHSELAASHRQLEAASQELKEYSTTLEAKVVERTEMLEQSKHTIETLKNKVEDALFSTMDPEVAKLIIEERLRSEKRRISVMFCDLAGFTGYSEEHQPEVVIGDLNNYLGEMEAVVMAYRGHIDKYTGDGLMVEWGAPIDYERHALLSVAAGLKMQERAVKGRFPWPMRLGIATGEPIVGLLGRKRQMYTAIGDSVNLASRIQEASTPGKVTVDEETYQDVKGFVEASKKTHLPFSEFPPDDLKALGVHLAHLETHPDDAEVLKKVGFILLSGRDYADANEYLKRALAIDPSDDKVKLAYADVSLKLEKSGDTAIRGHKRLLRLYEIAALKDPLKDESKIPARLLADYGPKAAAAADYPEDLILPVECLDGSIGVSRIVGFLSYVAADLLGLPDQEKKDILQAGYLAEIGKTIVPHHLLNRTGSLDKGEFEEVRKHSRESVRVLKLMGYQSEAMFKIIASHHEYPNGTGYPDGLSGDAIPLGARILAAAEEYASYVSWRPYRDRWDRRAAFAQISRDAQKGKFDPQVVLTLGRALDLGSS